MASSFKNIKDCTEGDIIQDRNGGKCKVLARLGPLIFRSEFYRYDIAAFHYITVEEAAAQGWKVLTKEGREPMTKKEIEDLMNIKITD